MLDFTSMFTTFCGFMVSVVCGYLSFKWGEICVKITDKCVRVVVPRGDHLLSSEKKNKTNAEFKQFCFS